MKRIVSFFVVLVLILSMFAGCGGKTESGEKAESGEKVVGMSIEDVKTKGEFIVGLDDTFAPMGFRETDGTLVGFDIDLATAVGEKLGVTVRFQPISWDAKEMELDTGNIDCIWNGFSITPAREEQLSMSKPYLGNHMVVMVNEGIEIAEKSDLAGLNIGIQSGSAALEAVRGDEIFSEIEGGIVEYPTYDEVILDMMSGRLDCMVIDEVFGEYKNAQMGSPYKTVTGFNFGEDLYAIGFRKQDTQLTKDVEGAIAQLIKDGVAGEISDKWFGTNIVLD